MESWNLAAPMRKLYDCDKRSLLAKAIKSNCGLNAVYVWAPYIGHLGIFERVRITWAKNRHQSDALLDGIMSGASIAPDFNACTVEEAFAYYFGY